MRFLNILMVFGLDFGQISFNLAQKAFATQQFALLAASIVFYDILVRACAEIKIFSFWTRKGPTSLSFSIFDIFFFAFPFSPFLFFFAAVIGLLLGLLTVKKTSKKASLRRANDHGVAMCSGRTFCSDFFTQLFEHFCAYLRLHEADHSDLGIIGRVFSFCRS